MTFKRVQRMYNEKGQSLEQMVLRELDMHMQNNEIGPYLIP